MRENNLDEAYIRPMVFLGSEGMGLRADNLQVHGMVAAFEELIGIIENGGTSVSPAREGRNVVQVMEGFLDSQQAGCRLVDVPA